MTPSLFTCAAQPQVSELDIANGWGSLDNARSVLEQHWDTFINQSDFQYLASIGINTVRLPIGYWTLGPDFVQGTPYENVSSVYQNSWSRVVRTINMAAQAGIGVLVDLHGAPGSQNGQQHSGISDGQTNLFDNPWYINKTMDVLSFLIGQLGYVTNVVGIEILNEPQDVATLPDFCTSSSTTGGFKTHSFARYPSDHYYEEHLAHRRKFSSVHPRRFQPRSIQRVRGKQDRLRCGRPSLVLCLYSTRRL